MLTTARRSHQARPRTSPSGYAEHPHATRPHCDMCGPFASRRVRVVGHDDFGPIYRCEGCDNED